MGAGGGADFPYGASFRTFEAGGAAEGDGTWPAGAAIVIRATRAKSAHIFIADDILIAARETCDYQEIHPGS
jgi:hypothetical protein